MPLLYMRLQQKGAYVYRLEFLTLESNLEKMRNKEKGAGWENY